MYQRLYRRLCAYVEATNISAHSQIPKVLFLLPISLSLSLSGFGAWALTVVLLLTGKSPWHVLLFPGSFHNSLSNVATNWLQDPTSSHPTAWTHYASSLFPYQCPTVAGQSTYHLLPIGTHMGHSRSGGATCLHVLGTCSPDKTPLGAIT